MGVIKNYIEFVIDQQVTAKKNPSSVTVPLYLSKLKTQENVEYAIAGPILVMRKNRSVASDKAR